MKKATRVFSVLIFCSASLIGQATFVLTNNDRIPNTVSVLSVAGNGFLVQVPGSPFLTGGNGAGGGFFASPRITSAVVKDFLFAANSAVVVSPLAPAWFGGVIRAACKAFGLNAEVIASSMAAGPHY